MKLKLATILFAASVMVSITSCEETNLGQAQLPPLAGEVVLTDVLGTSGSRVSPNYVLGVELGNSAGAVLEAKFASPAPTLQSGAYTEASASYATAGNYITGAEGTTLTINGEKHLVTAGTINLNAVDGTYTLNGIVKLNNGENYSVSWTGSGLAWNDLPQLKTLNTVLSAQSNLANGVKSVTLNLSDGNFTSELDMTTYQTVYKGAGNYLAIDLYSEDGYLAAGTYKPSAQGGAINNGEYGIGWDPGDIYNIGMAFENWGTCWWTVDETATPQTSAEKITTGDITVALNGTVYTITVDNGDLYAQFVGEIPAVTKPATPPTPPVLLGDYPYVVGMTDQYEQYKSVIVQFASTDKVAYNGMGWTGTGKVLNLTINAAKDGDNFYIPTGQYAVNLDGAENPFTWQGTGGMDLSEWGMGYMYWGTYISDIVDGTSTVTELKDGTIWVGAKNGEYILHMNTAGKEFLIYQGKINGLITPADDDAGYVEPEQPGDGEGEGSGCGCDCDGCKDCTGSGEGGNDDGGESFNGIMLTKLLSAAEQYDAYKQMVLQFGTDGVSFDAATYSYSGTGTVINLTIHAEKGDSGVYLPVGNYVAADSTTEPFTWQVTGGMPEYNFYWGTLMYDVVDGAATMTQCTEGTVMVEEGSITFMLGGMMYRYVGEIPVI